MRPLTILALALVLPGCGLGSIQDARNEYVKSTEKYDQCVAANPGAAERCEMLRQAMEADGRKYNEVAPNFLDQFSNKKKDDKTAGQYNECLTANRSTPEKCETQRVAVENDKKFDWGRVFRPGTPPPDYANAQH